MQFCKSTSCEYRDYACELCVLIIWSGTPRMSDAVDGPYNVQSENVSYKHLRYDGPSPGVVPEIHGYHRG